MPFSGATLITSLARRVRDTSNFAHPRATLLDILNRCSYSLNAATRSKIRSVTMTPTAGRVLYPTTEVASDVIYIIGVQDTGGRDLMEVPWPVLVLNDPDWIHTVGTRHQMFSRIGRDILVLYPAVKDADVLDLTIKYVQVPTALADDGVAWVLPDELEPVLLDLAEPIVYLRGRIFTPGSAIADPVGRASEALGVEVPHGMKRHAEDEK